MTITWTPFLHVELVVDDLKLFLGRVAKQYIRFIWYYSPDSAAPLVPINMLFHFPRIKRTNDPIETPRIQRILFIKGEVTYPSLMSCTIFSNQVALRIHVDRIDFIPTHKHLFLDGWDTACPNCILMFAVYFFL